MSPEGALHELPSAGDVVLLQTGGLGDLVLLSPLVAAIRRHRPHCRVTLLCRSGFETVSALWPVPPDRVIALGFDPEHITAPGGELDAAWATLDAASVLPHPVAVIDAANRPGWLGRVLAGRLGVPLLEAPSADLGTGHALARVALAQRGHPAPAVHTVHLPARLAETARNDALAQAMGVGPASWTNWRMPVPSPVPADWLGSRGLPAWGYVACSPGGAASTPIKRWPEARFVDVLRRLGHPVLLVGSAGEAPLLGRIAGALRDVPCAVFAGSPVDLPLLAGLLAGAALWFGNDTGPAHLAQAYGVPGVGLFGGGGRWPCYAPWGPGSLGLVMPLPCFGCDWDCPFGHALCIDGIGVPDALAALRRVEQAPEAPPVIVELAASPGLDLAVIGASADAYHASRREVALLAAHLLDATAERDAQAAAAAARLAALDDKHAELELQTRAAAERLAVIEVLDAALTQQRGVTPEPVAIQISTGLGAGNIGDELMADAFWSGLGEEIGLVVPLFPAARAYRGHYPRRHRYREVDWAGNETASPDRPGLLAGGTPVAEAEGLDFPLRFVGRRLAEFHARGLPVDAVGVGVEPLQSAAARELFAEHFAPIRSWSVRSAASRDALVALGVPADRIVVGADWAWLHRPAANCELWADAQWRELGVAPDAPLMAVNVVNMLWAGDVAARRSLARGLDLAADRLGLRIALFCNESREGAFYDRAAAEALAAELAHPAIIVPNAYYTPDEAIALLRRARVSVGQRYHFIVESVLAGSVPVSVPRGMKQRDLAAELGIEEVGSVEGVDSEGLAAAIERAVTHHDAHLAALALRRRDLERRAAGNLTLLRRYPPYALPAPSDPFSR